MKISLNWLKEYVDVKVPDDELIRLIGARLVEVEGVIDETHKYDKIKVVKVETAEKIPDTHLTLCQINDGGAELVQVVCGAPNVRVGMLAAWIAPGAIVPASVHEDAPFVIGKRKMLGKYDSNGMLAGADELDFGGDHSGIVEIDPEMAKPGDLLADVFELNDLILEIENKSLTHRPDCFGIIGFAREVAGILGIEFECPEILFSDCQPRARSFLQHFAQSSPRSSSISASAETNSTRLGRGKVDKNYSGSAGILSENNILNIQINTDICRRYTAIVLEKHGELEKKFLTLEDTLIAKSGMKPVDPIVDVTNYLMLLTGQPLHAFDYDKFLSVGKSETAKIGVRLAKKGEKLELLDGKVVECEPFDILVTSNDVPVALAGAMGGTNTAVDENTKNILLESATFSLYNLRKTQMAHGIFSEAITRFTKGQPASQTLEVAEACAEMFSTGFRVSAVADEYPNPEKPIVVKITADEINGLLGTEYTYGEIEQTLKNVGFGISCDCGKEDTCNCEYINIAVPVWRTDIHIKEDIIEEVGRLLGYENIQLSLPLHGTATRDEIFEFKHEVRDLLAKFGANEVLTYSFVSEKLLEKAGLKKSNSYKIVNSISPDLQLVRQTIVPSLLDKAYLNIKLPVDKFAIFEMNKVYQKDLGLDDEEVPVEKINLGFVVAERKNSEAAFYKAKKYLDLLIKHFGVNVSYVPLKNHSPITQPFEPKRSAEVVLENGEVLGVVGEFKNSVKNDFKLGDYTAGFEIDLELLCKNKAHHKNINFIRKEMRDLTIKTTKTYGEIAKRVHEIICENGCEAEIMPGVIYQPEGASEKNMTLHIEFTKFDEKIMPILENL